MEITIDDYGRVVIPKPIRERLGLEAGTELDLQVEQSEDGGESIRLRPTRQAPALEKEGRVLVHTGTLPETLDPVDSVRETRTRRTAAIAGSTGTR